jgi:xanthine dehydrogenase YagR molybdenum-binding subunit
VTGAARYSSDIQAGRLALRHDSSLEMAGGKNFVGQSGQGAANPRHQGCSALRAMAHNIRYYGEEIAAVAGTTKQACLDALAGHRGAGRAATEFRRVKTRRARRILHAVWEGFAQCAGNPHARENGSVDTAFPECAAVIEGFYTTPVQIHHPMETAGNTVSWTDDGLTSWASTQGISSVRDGLAGALKLEQSKVRVITEYMGGGFGAKFGPGVSKAVLAAKLSKEAKAPVRLMLTRFDQALAVGNRPSSFQKIKIGAHGGWNIARVRIGKLRHGRHRCRRRRLAAAAVARIFPRLTFTKCRTRG